MEAKRKQDDDGVHSSIAGKRPKNDLPDGSPVNPLQIDTGNTQIDETSKLDGQLSQALENFLEDNASKSNLTALNVKSIIRVCLVTLVALAMMPIQ